MITAFAHRFTEKQKELEAIYAEQHPDSWEDIVLNVVKLLHSDNDDYPISSERIHAIDDGDCQGTLVCVIGAEGYQPSKYWYTIIDYGSCSGCDAFQSIRGYSDDKPTATQTKDYIALSLSVVQNMREMEHPLGP